MHTQKEIKAKVKELGGWWDLDKIRFPSVHLMQQFIDWIASHAANHPALPSGGA